MDTILIGSNFYYAAHEIANIAKDTSRDVAWGAWIPRFCVKPQWAGLLPLGSSLAPSHQGKKGNAI
jgi:hypothetical protein